MANGQMNWQGLLAYEVQPSDMDLFQKYMQNAYKGVVAATRTPGILSGGMLTAVAGMQVGISAGVALMPDGQIVSFPSMALSIATADPTRPRIDRIMLAYSSVAGTAVQDVNSNPLTLDFIYQPSLVDSTGTPASSPVPPSAVTANLSLGLITVPAGVTSILSGYISQIPAAGFDISSFSLGGTAGLFRWNPTSHTLQYSNDGSVWQAIGSGGGGGGGIDFAATEGDGALSQNEYGDHVFVFEAGATQRAVGMLKVPHSYLSGKPITLYIGQYSSSSSGTQFLMANCYLVRKGVDPVSSTANAHATTNLPLTNTVALQYREATLDITDANGLINSVAVSPGDLIRIELTRGSDSDTSDIRFIPSAQEVAFQ